MAFLKLFCKSLDWDSLFSQQKLWDLFCEGDDVDDDHNKTLEILQI